MIVAIDVGNTNLSVGIIDGGGVRSMARTATQPTLTPDELVLTLDGLLVEEGAALADVDEIVLVSVVPSVSAAVAELAGRHEIHLLTADSTTIPMAIRVERPAQVGDDRLINAFAAVTLHGAPAIVVDMGTATTFDVVAADGAFVGGAIAPGLGLGVEALAARTAKLPRIPLVMPLRAIGRDTVSAMQSGAIIGYIGLVRELVRAITAELALDGGATPAVILTGGLAAAPWAEDIPGVDVIDPLLTMRGLALLHAEFASATTPAQAQA